MNSKDDSPKKQIIVKKSKIDLLNLQHFLKTFRSITKPSTENKFFAVNIKIYIYSKVI